MEKKKLINSFALSGPGAFDSVGDLVVNNEYIHHNSLLDFDYNGDNEIYVMCTYYSDKLKKSVIMDWSFDVADKTADNLADCILRLEQESIKLESLINI